MPRFAQHFLINQHAVQRIVDSLDLSPHDSVLEIGPGKGVLTAGLVTRAARVTAVEVDEIMAQKLRERFHGAANFKLIHADFLEMDLSTIEPPVKVAGNLPYNITSPILRRLSDWQGWTEALLMVQKEVGDRLCAGPGSKTYGALTVGVNLGATVEPVFTLSDASFDPRPKVKSMVIRITRRPEPLTPDVQFTQKVVQAAFQQRRKTILNSLSHGLQLTKEEILILFEELRIPPDVRAETLTVDQFVQLSRLIKLKSTGQ